MHAEIIRYLYLEYVEQQYQVLCTKNSGAIYDTTLTGTYVTYDCCRLQKDCCCCCTIYHETAVWHKYIQQYIQQYTLYAVSPLTS